MYEIYHISTKITMKKCRYYTLFTTKNVNIQQKLQQHSQKLVKIISKNLIKSSLR